ncbi:ATP-dependent Clp protease proteolytic subunit [bacterium]|nr:ATP-dependent Clp protease proteolytic subunit [bacterium]
MNSQSEITRGMDYRGFIEQRLLKDRSILIYGQITQEMAQEVSEKLLILSSDSNSEIKIYINSQGGHVESGDTIFDMIRFSPAPVKMIGTGWVASAGALIYAAPPVEQRYTLPNTRFLLHQPMGGMSGSATELAIETEEIIKMRRRLNKIFSAQTGQPPKRVEKDTDRNYWMTAMEAKEYGLVGKIIEKADAL